MVLRYAYLWADEAALREGGRKDRPAVVVLKREIVQGALVVTVAAITHSPPRGGRFAVEVGAVVKKRLGLDDGASWVVTDELNSFVWPGPDLRPIDSGKDAASSRCDYGFVPNSLLQKIINGIVENRARQRMHVTKRSE